MESVTAAAKKEIERFVDVGYGQGSGEGWGTGSGEGWGWGTGDGEGAGEGIKSFDGNTVYYIDDIATIIRAAKDNVAKGYILGSDLTLSKCYIVKQGNVFAHGETKDEAFEALRDKLFEQMPEEERIAAFWKEHRRGVKYAARDLYDWHHRLTGSCEMGRNQFVKDAGIDLDADEFTPEEFIERTRNAYGGKIIRRLAEK